MYAVKNVVFFGQFRLLHAVREELWVRVHPNEIVFYMTTRKNRWRLAGARLGTMVLSADERRFVTFRLLCPLVFSRSASLVFSFPVGRPRTPWLGATVDRIMILGAR